MRMTTVFGSVFMHSGLVKADNDREITHWHKKNPERSQCIYLVLRACVFFMCLIYYGGLGTARNGGGFFL